MTDPGQRESIAIIGIGCRFPGGADSPEALWQLLLDQVDAISEVPANRFDVDAFHDPRPGAPGKIITRFGGFLDGMDQFDASFFGISPREAAGMDPQHRLLLEVAWEALEDAGQVPGALAQSRTGVYIGMCTNDYEDLQYERPSQLDIYNVAGAYRSVAAGRLSFALDLQGPSLTVDTACASSLVAVHLACQSLETGECTLALAGGVNLVLQPQATMGFSSAQMLAPDGRCKFGDLRADGFVRSDGVGIVVLKPLSRARADGDPIYAVIRGSAVNDDGRGSGFLMTPSRAGQEAVLREAYRRAGVSPGRVQYVEAHGTGTPVGDSVELQALGTVLAEGRSPDHPCVVGSLKTNIGHTEGAAGVAGLIKAALCLTHRAIPAVLHLREPSPAIPWADLPLVLPRQLEPWPAGAEPALAGVSAFGISGVNAHVVLEAAPQFGTVSRHAPWTQAAPHLLPLSAAGPEALKALAGAYQELLAAATEDAPSFHDVCYTAGARRTHHAYRLAVVGQSSADLVARLQAYARGEDRAGAFSGYADPRQPPRIAFVFPGQGSQWLGMGRQLLGQEPVFRAAIEQCDAAIRRYADWSLLTELTTGDDASLLGRIDVIQPALFAIQVALAALWRSWGIKPAAVVGHSMGEVAAAHVAGALSLDDAARIICRRSQLLWKVSGSGAMAVVELSVAAAQEALAGYEHLLSVAVSNSARSTVISGDPAALQEVLTTLARQGVFCRPVKVDVASHSPQMDVLRTDLLDALAGLYPQAAHIPIYSTLTAEIADGATLDALYWARNLREPVRFSTAVQQLLAGGHRIFVEISPHPVLLQAIVEGARQLSQDGDTAIAGEGPVVLPSLRREHDERTVLLESLAVLYTQGCAVDWSRLYPAGGQSVRLPAYPWQRERFWLADGFAGGGMPAPAARRRPVSQPDGHPLLGEHRTLAMQPDTHVWESELGLDLLPYLADHRVQGIAVLPAAAYVEMALAAATQVYGPEPHTLRNMRFHKALLVPEDGGQRVQVILAPDLPGTATFQLFSQSHEVASQPAQQAAWTLHATGTIRLGEAVQDPVPWREGDPREALQARCPRVISRAEHYQALGSRGLRYGPAFQGVEQVWSGDGEALARVRLPAALSTQAHAYQLHPALLDAGFQVLGATLPRSDARITGGDTYVPVALEQLRLPGSPAGELWGYGLLRQDAVTAHSPLPDGGEAAPSAGALEGDVFMLDQHGQVVVEARGLRFARLDRGAESDRDRESEISRWFYEVQWQPHA
ncbi:MAG TPA: type I polyketide synthase, partial [Chloroflexota bacterium]|nr:type I polyketide synthase [Chloroflexota bacterium]